MERIRVLHVDDDTTFANTTSQLLEQVADNFAVETETEPSAVVDRLADDEFDCVVSDYQMPEMNGLELLDTLREEYPDLPFILYTGRGSEEIASKAISRGVTDYLQKQTGTDHYELLANRIKTAASSYRAKHRAECERKQRTALFEHSTDPMLDVTITTDRSKVLAINDAFEETFGYDADEIRGQDAAALLVPDEAQDVHESLKRRLLTGDPIETEVQRETADGLRDFLARAIPYEGATGQQHAYVWYMDITEQKRRERELEASHANYRSLFENNPLNLWEGDFSTAIRYLDELAESVDNLEAYLTGTPTEAHRLIDKIDIVKINETAVEYYGAPSKAVLLDNFAQIFTDQAVEEFVSAAVALARGQRHYRTETVTRTVDGNTNHELIDIYVPETYTDDCSRVYVTGVDISERKA